MAANIAGRAALSGAKQLATGNRPKLEDLLLTPANAKRLTDNLSNMRGGAMKIGQMISMDSGDLLPKELSDILARLRSEANHMPQKQLDAVLVSQWGDNWRDKFESFETDPIAAASIGQVHSGAVSGFGDVAIKVQYPGVRESIDSDIDNVVTLLNMTGMIPKELDTGPIITEARLQLHQEADYKREASYLARFHDVLKDNPDFAVPSPYPDLTTDRILVMSYMDGEPIESLSDAPQETRNRVVIRLMELVLRELFEFHTMQTDPNFANYQYNSEADQIVLLDFGATRDIDQHTRDNYRKLMGACLSGEAPQVFQTLIEVGFMAPNIPASFLSEILEIIEIAIEPYATDRVFDFGSNAITTALKDRMMDLTSNRELWHIPPPETMFIQRKLGGVYLLASRLGAQINVHELMNNFFEQA